MNTQTCCLNAKAIQRRVLDDTSGSPTDHDEFNGDFNTAAWCPFGCDFISVVDDCAQVSVVLDVEVYRHFPKCYRGLAAAGPLGRLEHEERCIGSGRFTACTVSRFI